MVTSARARPEVVVTSDVLRGAGGTARCSDRGGLGTTRGDDPTVRQDLTVVVEKDYPVAQQAPPLFWVAVHDVGSVSPGAVRGRAAGLMGTHRVRLTHSFLL